ncbi:ras GTPase-activating protein nGAP-like, partial [Egretta garzetta]|uniref:ras GTPase-activating protein nGAP-like n=1 Tax=Egretta garzetta TaxID=188379 RepID=UPI00163BEF0B
PQTLLKTYKWRTAAPMGGRDAERGAGSPGTRRWTRLQGWKRSYSHPESGGPHDAVGKGSSNLGAPKASTRRSLFQRAFSAPSKGPKEPRGPEGGKATLQKYLRSMAKRKGPVESGGRAEQVLHDLALSLWVYEAGDLPPRRRLRCHLHLDGTLFARTTAKVAGPDGELFWGELFQLAALPPARALTLALCRDDHPGQPVASITVPLAELAAARQPLERWYPLSSAGGSERVPSVRVRGRYREVRVLPIVRYKELAEFITFHYRELCARLEPTIAVRHKEELAGALVHVLQSTGKAKVERGAGHGGCGEGG